MDERIREHARILTEWSAGVEAGDDVVVLVGDGAHELAVAVANELGERGANMLTLAASSEISRAYLRAHDEEFAAAPEYEQQLYEHADVVLSLRGPTNTSEASDITDATQQAYATARAPIREARLDTDWVSTIHPTRALAQQAGMSFAAYQEFVYDAILRDWAALASEMAQLKSALDAGETVRIQTGAGTDLTLSIANRTAINSAASVDYDSHNLPSGEVFTAPTATEGTVVFDLPLTYAGERFETVELTFEDGEVTDYDADNVELLETILETDPGARRLGELGIGMNDGIDQFTDNILFDEKMSETIHLALGRAYDACLPADEDGNDSAVHVDMLVDMSTDASLSIDGETVLKNGQFQLS